MKHIKQNLQVGVKATLTFSDNSIARVYISEIESFSFLGDEYWFKYEDDETNRQLVNFECANENRHFNLNFNFIEVLLLNNLLHFEIEPIQDFNMKLEEFISRVYPKEIERARLLFNNLAKVAGEEHIVDEYFNNPKYN